MVEIELSNAEVTTNGMTVSTGSQENVGCKSLDIQPERNEFESSSVELDLDLVEKLRALLRADFEVNADKYSEIHFSELMDERSPSSCWRYLLHCKGNIDETLALIKAALVWRKENSVDELRNEELIKEFWLHAPVMFTGVSRDGNYDVLYVIGKNYRKPEAILRPVIRKFFINLLFSWDRKHKDDLRKFYFIFDVSETGLRNIDLDYMSWLVSIRDYFPQRPHRILVIGVPFIVRPLVQLVISWLPENFSNIVQCGTFEQLVEPNIDASNLPAEISGQEDESYRLAPLDALWAAQSAFYSVPEMRRAIEEAIGFSVSTERRAKLQSMQMDHESMFVETS